MEEFSAKLYELTRERGEIAVITVIKTTGSTPRKAGSKMIVNSDGTVLWGSIGGGKIEHMAVQAAAKAIMAGKPEMIEFSLQGQHESDDLKEKTGMICGGNMTVFIDVPDIKDNLFIVGSGHIARELCPLAKKSGFRVTVIDDREGTVTRENFPEAYDLITGGFRESLDKVDFTSRDYVVIITYSHVADEIALETCLRKKVSKWKYIGMISSVRKANEIFTRLKQKGIDQELLDRVRAPIGLFKAQRPYDIAISILGELIQVRDQ
ncbi:MAG: XdhC family protein [Candidatus Hodarchaeales archaeon]